MATIVFEGIWYTVTPKAAQRLQVEGVVVETEREDGMLSCDLPAYRLSDEVARLNIHGETMLGMIVTAEKDVANA